MLVEVCAIFRHKNIFEFQLFQTRPGRMKQIGKKGTHMARFGVTNLILSFSSLAADVIGSNNSTQPFG